MASKLHISLFAGLLFYVLSNPITYTILNTLLADVGIPISVSGKPTGTGLLLHSALYTLIVYILMKV